MKIVMIGAGYVGLVTGACFAEFGHHVVCVDTDQEKIDQLCNGDIPIYEPGLGDLVAKGVREERLSFTKSLSDAVPDADAVFIAVGTPTSRRGDGHADLSYVYAAAEDVAVHLQGYTVVVDKSTVPVGTAQQVARIIKEKNPDAEFDIASNPEFLREGAAIKDFTHPDRVVIGVDSERAENVLCQIYDTLSLSQVPIVCTDIETAELIKYAANAFLATKISFINEMAGLCEKLGANVVDLALGIGMDGRIGAKFLHPGPGFGGSCFPKDTIALLRTAQEQGKALRIVEASVEANSSQKSLMIKKICDAAGGDVSSKTIAVLGLAFKPETDDMRDAPALTILSALIGKGAIIRAHDPQAMDEARELLPDSVEYCDNSYHACEGVDVVVLMTEWNQYRGLDLTKIKSVMKSPPVFVDLRNVYKPDHVREYGFEYVGVGRN